MERALRPDRFDAAPDTPTSEKEFKYWLKTLENYFDVIPPEQLKKFNQSFISNSLRVHQ